MLFNLKIGINHLKVSLFSHVFDRFEVVSGLKSGAEAGGSPEERRLRSLRVGAGTGAAGQQRAAWTRCFVWDLWGTPPKYRSMENHESL